MFKTAWAVSKIRYTGLALLRPFFDFQNRKQTNGAFLQEKPRLNSKIQKWILYFFAKQINQRSLGLWCIKGTEQSTLGKDSSIPSMHHVIRVD